MYYFFDAPIAKEEYITRLCDEATLRVSNSCIIKTVPSIIASVAVGRLRLDEICLLNLPFAFWSPTMLHYQDKRRSKLLSRHKRVPITESPFLSLLIRGGRKVGK